MADEDATMIDDVFAKRYGEVLLVRACDSGPEATVYNTFPLNDCPPQTCGTSSTRRRSRPTTAPRPRYSTDRGTG